MTHKIEPFGKAMTAIAAVLAFSTTQAFAQDITTPPDPVADTSAQTPQTPDPLAPEASADEPAATEEAAPPPAKPKVETSRAATPRAKPSASASTPRRTVQRASAAAPAATAAAPAAEAAAPAPLPAEPLPPVAVEPAAPPIAEPAPASPDPSQLMSDLTTDDMLPITGAAALGLLALAGAGIAMRRRKRRLENEEFEARQQALATVEDEPAEPPTLELDRHAEVRPGPVFARTPAPMHDPVPDKKAPVTTLPNGFDVSQYGPHVQAAYRGPTPDNPSVSLEYRVRRAAALDEQESEPAEQR